MVFGDPSRDFAGVSFDDNGKVQAGMGSAAGDLDGDGKLDLIKTNFIEETSNIYVNNGDESFTDRVYSQGAGVSTEYMGWGVGFLDFDRDTWTDLVVANGHVHPEIEALVPNNPYHQRRLLYRNLGGKKLENVSATAGPGITTPHSSRGLAVGNDTKAAGNFLSLTLVGTTSNRSAVGARVTVTAGDRVMVREVRSGSSFMSHSDLRVHFGLGEAGAVDRIEVEWPSAGSRETIESVKGNQFITITEGERITENTPVEGGAK